MAYDSKPGTFVLFQNNKKADNHPDYKGTMVTLEGETLEIAGWKKKSAKGEVYLSGSIQKPFVKQEPEAAGERPVQANTNNAVDNLPF